MVLEMKSMQNSFPWTEPGKRRMEYWLLGIGRVKTWVVPGHGFTYATVRYSGSWRFEQKAYPAHGIPDTNNICRALILHPSRHPLFTELPYHPSNPQLGLPSTGGPARVSQTSFASFGGGQERNRTLDEDFEMAEALSTAALAGEFTNTTA